MIAIIDSGGANIASVQFALERLGAKSVLTRDAAEIAAASPALPLPTRARWCSDLARHDPAQAAPPPAPAVQKAVQI